MVMLQGSSLIGRHSWVVRQQQLTGPGPAYCQTREAGGSDATVGAGGGADVVPGPFTPQARPAGGHMDLQAAGFLTQLPLTMGLRIVMMNCVKTLRVTRLRKRVLLRALSRGGASNKYTFHKV